MSQNTQPPHLAGIREKDRLMTLLASSRHNTLAALRDMDDFAMIYSDDEWRLKDVLSHIAVWEREALAALLATMGTGQRNSNLSRLIIHSFSVTSSGRGKLNPNQT